MAIELDYHTPIRRRSARRQIALTLVSLAVGVLGLLDEAADVRRAFRYIAGANSLDFIPSDALSLKLFLAFTSSAALLSCVLILAASVAFRFPTLSWRLYAIYGVGMVVVAVLLAMSFAHFCSADPVAPPFLVLIVFFLNGIWYAAYPVFITYLLVRSYRAALRQIES